MYFFEPTTTDIPTTPVHADIFKDEVIELLNEGELPLAVSIGHLTGLFDTLSILPPSTTREIVRVADLVELYVQVWLDTMVEGGIVVRDPNTELYSLPPECTERVLTAGENVNLSVFNQYLELRGSDQEWIADCFQNTCTDSYDIATDPNYQTVAHLDLDQTVIVRLPKTTPEAAPNTNAFGCNITRLICAWLGALKVRFAGQKPVERRSSLWPHTA